jgi:hypothetical protein
MAGHALTIAAMLQCPHGGAVKIIPGDLRSRAGGAGIARSSDTYLIVGCPFFIGPKPSPCLRVQWVSPDLRVTASGSPSISETSVGLCMNAEGAPQGPPIVVTTQQRLATQ